MEIGAQPPPPQLKLSHGDGGVVMGGNFGVGEGYCGMDVGSYKTF